MLTPKEFEVLNLVSKGHPTHVIAEKMGISAYTVEGHRKQLLKKFRAKNSIDMVRKAMKEKWLKN
ncbi:MAG TPA: helix-turn-helix transcriptional regulator [Cyclobacteriaceae bacterium]|nr:helix-turn-helix transcriptional regulator [Cyclobacteriaceae bacterium]MCB9238702.1 helix-turn-helix transcriptional regulator [Flammeovirgaceae bacterium]MCB0497978.1 helix-turn-helix transcriptional regulator [Cyclobacteriaceae bacterium]MCO5270420.1 helix-turn-helix transcriptional regulator [Cyclobacteriaceae bacterium]MCW5901138.1 helix-turn-helix transcriptional regulator [Cyclobacteriaceae bacterium]